MKWSGTDEFTRWLNDTPADTMRAVEGALFTEAEVMMGVSKRRTPVDTGRLRSTGHVKPPQTRGGKTEVVLGYGTDYAIYVHERPARHPVGQAKYLESAVLEGAVGLAARLKADVLDRIGKS
jgi:hypothetical protein